MPAVHDSRGPCSEKGPFAARSSRSVFPDGCLQGFSDAWRANLAKTSSFRMHGGDILPRTGAFPARGSFGNASGRYLAMVDGPGTHRGDTLPLLAARERTTAIPCHGRPLSRMPLEGILPRRPSAARACSSGRREHAGKTDCSTNDDEAINPPPGDAAACAAPEI